MRAIAEPWRPFFKFLCLHVYKLTCQGAKKAVWVFPFQYHSTISWQWLIQNDFQYLGLFVIYLLFFCPKRVDKRSGRLARGRPDTSVATKTQPHLCSLSMLKTTWAPPLLICTFWRRDMKRHTGWDRNCSALPTLLERTSKAPSPSFLMDIYQNPSALWMMPHLSTPLPGRSHQQHLPVCHEAGLTSLYPVSDFIIQKMLNIFRSAALQTLSVATKHLHQPIVHFVCNVFIFCSIC